MGPLSGLKVIELSAMGPVPFCGMLLADMGADVLRIDRPDDATRITGDLRGRNKRSTLIDLKHRAGCETFKMLVEQADILIEGYRAGVMERLGLGPDDCMARRPSLIYGRATGWGQNGPLAQTAGHDINYIALTGALAMIGPARGAPVPPLNLLGDYGGGALYLAFGTLCAWIEACASGKGQVVDAAIVDGVASLLTVFHSLRRAGQITNARASNMLDGGSPYYSTYLTKDGAYVAIGALEPKFYIVLLERLGINPATLPSRDNRAYWPQLRAIFATRFLEKTRAEWEERFAGFDACFAPVLSFDEAAEHPHNAFRGVTIELDGIVQPRPAPRFSRTPGSVRAGPPEIGGDTIQALLDWGIQQSVIDAGLAAGVLIAQDTR
jgi:alpha-methylacyl-CoA racemase